MNSLYPSANCANIQKFLFNLGRRELYEGRRYTALRRDENTKAIEWDVGWQSSFLGLCASCTTKKKEEQNASRKYAQ